ncbi:hypothetical protein [Tabrizicola sp.]
MHWTSWVYVVAIAAMPVVMAVMSRKVTAQRQRQNDLLERIATALEQRKP